MSENTQKDQEVQTQEEAVKETPVQESEAPAEEKKGFLKKGNKDKAKIEELEKKVLGSYRRELKSADEELYEESVEKVEFDGKSAGKVEYGEKIPASMIPADTDKIVPLCRSACLLKINPSSAPITVAPPTVAAHKNKLFIKNPSKKDCHG